MKRLLQAVVTLALLLIARGVQAQDPVLVAESLERFGFLDWDAVGARALGMGGAYRAAGRDVLALRYNPAGLARVRHRTVHVGFGTRSTRREITYFGSPSEKTTSSTFLESAAFAYPVPTYRGSLVLGAGVFRTHSSDVEFLLNGTDTVSPVTTRDWFQHDGSGGLWSWEAGFGIDLSPRIAFGLALAVLDEDLEAFSTFESDTLSSGVTGFIDDQLALDVDGYDVRMGLQIRARDGLVFSLSGHRILGFSWEGSAFTQAGSIDATGTTVEAEDTYLIRDDIEFPFVFSGGVALQVSDFTLAGDLRYNLWSEVSVDPPRGGPSVPLDGALDDTWDLMLGAEYAFRAAPVHLRAGFAHVPHPYKFLKADVSATAEEVSHHTDRKFVTGGVGVVLDRVVILDAAVVWGGHERSVPGIEEDLGSLTVRLSGGYRF
jgi:hypothetical protein